ncbi:hypothetical protein EV421DRAFT_1712545, partial [Armillaria borealis]
MGEFVPDEDDVTIRAKRLLQKCAYAMMSKQELSGQEVALYLSGYKDHYTSHSFRNVYWANFERAIEAMDPSPECRMMKKANDCANDNVYIATNPSGSLIVRSSLVEDYIHHGSSLKDVSMWEYVSWIQKVTKASLKRRRKHVQDDEYDSDDELFTDNYADIQIPFEEEHKEASTHVQVQLPLDKWVVPVPWGESLPRQDRVAIYPRYCRLMLVFFKPWKSAHDLCVPGKTWSEILSDFHKANPDFARRMDNMQLLHECRDSRDDH